MEIIVLPYLAISFSIAWAIFSPFAEIENLHAWSFARIETSDLLAVFLPVSFLLALTTWMVPTQEMSVLFLASIAILIIGFAAFGFIAGLFLLAKMDRTTPMKRMAVIGIVIPMGSLLTLAWIALPLFAFTGSVLYAIPASLAVIPATLALRGLSDWVCHCERVPE